MVDLNMPEGQSGADRQRWLEETGAALVRETGQPMGVTEHQAGEHGQPVWGMWWAEDEVSDDDDESVV